MTRTLDRRLLVAGGVAAGAAVLGSAAVLGGRGRWAPSKPVPSAAPRRIVSLNPCLDVILVEVADRDRIAALSRYSRDRYGSTIAEIARSLPVTHGTAEEILALSPDLILTGPGQVRTDVLDRLGLRAEVFPVPETVAVSLEQVRRVAALVGRSERGEAMVARIETALAAAAPPSGARRPSALVFMPGGFASGPGTLMDEMMRRAGLDNAAARYGLRRTGTVPLERLIADPPDLLLAGEPTAGAPARAERLLRHPAIARVEAAMSRAVLPERLLFCGGPVLIPTAEVLARARRSVEACAA